MLIKNSKVNERLGYILDNYHYLLTIVEHRAYYSFVSSTDGKYKDFGNTEVRKLIELGEEKFYKYIEDRIISESKGKIQFNYCPRCNRLTKTPKSKMCLKCKHKWHNE